MSSFPDLSPQLKNLALTSPIMGAVEHKGSVLHYLPAEVRDGVDLAYLMLAALDLILERMGLEDGALFDELRDFLALLAGQQVPDMSLELRTRVAETVIDQLLNTGDNERRFEVSYFDPVSQKRIRFEFLLVRHHEDEHGVMRLKLSEQGIVLHLGMLDLDPISAQEGQELVISNLIRRGRFAEAVSAAQLARANSIRFRERVLSRLAEANRRLDQVAWREDLEPLLEEARVHLSASLERELMLVRTIEDQLEEIALEEPVRQLLLLRSVIAECQERHVRLQELVSDAAERFRTIQATQFRVRRRSRLPDPEDDLLRPFLRLSMPVLEGRLEALLAWLMPPRIPYFDDDLGLGIAWADRDDEPTALVVVDGDSELIERIAPQVLPYSQALVDEAIAFINGKIANSGDSLSMSELLEAARGRSAEFIHCLFLVLEQSINPGSASIMAKARLSTKVFDAGFVAGNDVTFRSTSSSEENQR